MPRKKTKTSLLKDNLMFLRTSGRTVQAGLFVAIFGVLGGAGWMAYSASAATGDAVYGGSCKNPVQYMGNVSASAKFNNRTNLKYVVLSVDGNINPKGSYVRRNWVGGGFYPAAENFTDYGRINNRHVYRVDLNEQRVKSIVVGVVTASGSPAPKCEVTIIPK